jgi:prolyl oligopeptidase
MRFLWVLAAMTVINTTAPAHAEDPYLWLEEVQGERALNWVRERNAQARRALEAEPSFVPIRERLLGVLNASERIPEVSRQGDHFYNLWKDAEHPRGLWRRIPIAEFAQPKPQWETVLDLDALATREHENWVWAGFTCLGPREPQCLLSLSRGGADATVVREFNLVDKRFVAGGFELAEAKSWLTWIDADHLYVATDFGPGSITRSGYPRLIKRWRRGQPLAEAAQVFEGDEADVIVSVQVDRTPGFERTVFTRDLDFFRTRAWLLREGALQPVDKPDDAKLNFWREHLLLELRSDWNLAGTLHPKGSLLAADAARWPAGERRLQPLFTPTPTRALAGFVATRSHLVLNLLDNVASRLEERHWAGGAWQTRAVQAPFPGSLSVASLHDPQLDDDAWGEHYLVRYTDFLTPDTLMLGRAGSDERTALKSQPTFFDARGMQVEQAFATSKDGTRVPYFIVWPAGAKASGDNRTLLYGYGGFEISMQPWYLGEFGSAWIERGGVFVLANIRGGGEFGPAWHQAAMKANKQNSYDDFIAVAQDLIERKVTRPRRLGISGGSNGGLLVAAVALQRPELFSAVASLVPLLDMQRYHKLLAGASWMVEYGNPEDPAEWAYISRYSPYQNVRADMKLPRTMFTTSTRDDRVHPGHARKMTARMLEQGHAVLYHENIEGGHGGAADNAQRADMMALRFAFLYQQLGGE